MKRSGENKLPEPGRKERKRRLALLSKELKGGGGGGAAKDVVEVIRELFKRPSNNGERQVGGGVWSSIPLGNACRRKHNRPGTMDYVLNTRGTLVPASFVETGQCLRKCREDGTELSLSPLPSCRAIYGGHGRKINNFAWKALPEDKQTKGLRDVSNEPTNDERKEPYGGCPIPRELT